MEVTQMENQLKQGETLFAEGRIDEAAEVFLSAVEKDRNNKEAYNNLGVIAIEKRDVESAIECFTRSLEIDPFYKDALINYTDLLKTLNQLHIAAPLLEKIIEKDPNDKEIAKLLKTIRPSVQVRLKIAVLCLPGLESFLKDIVDFLKVKHDVKVCYSTKGQDIETAIKWADTVWLEWANELALKLTNHPTLLEGKRVICRLHSYEAFTNFPKQIDWNVIDKVIFVAEHIKNITQELAPKIKTTSMSIIPNGINLEKWKFRTRRKGFNIAYVGSINYKKGSILLPHLLNAVYNKDKRYRLHIAGEIQDPRYAFYFKQMVQDMGLSNNFIMYGKIDDIDTWLEDKNYILSASLLESQQLSLCEAMAKGIKPVIHNFVGAKDIYPGKYVFNTIDEAADMIHSTDYKSAEYRRHISERYNLTAQLEKIDIFIKDLIKEHSSQATKEISQIKENNTKDEPSSPIVPVNNNNLRKPHRNLIITGIPRSGSSLFSVLINNIENAVCLNEIVYDVSILPQAFEEIRKLLILKAPIPNKYDNSGVLSTNTMDGTVNIESKIVEIVDENVLVGSKVNIPYLNQIHTILEYGYKVIAIVRDPVFTIGSWNSKKTSHLHEARVTGENMSLRWDHIPFTTEEKIGRQAQIWQYYASLIWSLRDRIKIYTYEQMTSNTEWLLKDVCEYLGLNLPQKSKPLENLNSESRYPNIAEIREAVKQYCSISREFGYQNSDSSKGLYRPQKYWEDRGANYEVSTKEYNSNVEIPILESIIEKHSLYDSAILEVGSGYGRIYQDVGEKCSNYTMCDFSNSMRKECKIRTNIFPDYWDGHKLPYPDKSFDLVILFSVLLHVPDEQIKKFFSEICRVTDNYIFIATYTGNLSVTADHVFKHDYNILFKSEGLKTVFEKKIKDGLRTNWLVKKQPQATKLKSAKIDLLQTTI